METKTIIENYVNADKIFRKNSKSVRETRRRFSNKIQNMSENLKWVAKLKGPLTHAVPSLNLVNSSL